MENVLYCNIECEIEYGSKNTETVRNGRRAGDDISTISFINENVCILIKNSLQFVPNGN